MTTRLLQSWSPLRLRSVVDLSNDKTRLRRAMLSIALAATWREYVAADHIPLELMVLGRIAPPLRELLEDLGARLTPLEGPHLLAHRSPTYNKLLALPRRWHPGRLLLVDNDVVFCGPIRYLKGLSSSSVLASVADKDRVARDLLTSIEQDLALRLVDRTWVPWKEAVEARIEQRSARSARGLYFNSGVVLLPRSPRFSRLWQDVTKTLSGYLEQKGLHDRKSVGSDQLSLSLASASWKRNADLPLGAHYKVFNFWNHDLPAEQISIVHLVANGRYHKALRGKSALNVSDMISHYWDQFILEDDKLAGPDARADAEKVREKVLTAISRINPLGVDRALSPYTPHPTV